MPSMPRRLPPAARPTARRVSRAHSEGYYAAFIRDPDGNRIEAVTFIAGK